MEDKVGSLKELFTGKYELTEEQELYYKMIGLTYDISNKTITKEDLKFFKDNFHKFLHVERIRMFEHRDLSKE